MDPPTVRIRHLTHRFGKQVALRDVSVDIPQGRLIGVVGPNGSGKTTMMRCIAGLVKPTAGDVTVRGVTARKAVRLRPAQIGYMPQEGGIYPELSARANVRFFGRLAGLGKDLDAAADAALTAVALEDRAKDRASTFSGGMMQRLNLACALVPRPPLLLLDEPTSGVDPVLRNRMWKDLLQLRQEGATILVSTHDASEARRCDDVLLLRHGEVLGYASPKRLLHDTGTKDLEDAFVQLVEGRA